MRLLTDSKNTAAERSLVRMLMVSIVLMESLETGGGNLVLKARTSGTVRRDASDTGCIEGFSEAENHIENAMKITNSISIFCALKSVMKVKLFLLCHS